jgi:hypothetical protein
LATSFTEEEGFTVITGETITSRAFMIDLPFCGLESYRARNCL